MIEHIKGNIFDHPVEALVNSVNCSGIVNYGLAEQFRKVYPENYWVYIAYSRRKQVRPGSMLVFEPEDSDGLPRFIINFPTKRDWRDYSRMEDIESGLEDLARVIRERNIRSISIPALGTGMGGLDWDEVRPRIEQTIGTIEGVRVLIFEPRIQKAFDKNIFTPVISRGKIGKFLGYIF